MMCNAIYDVMMAVQNRTAQYNRMAAQALLRRGTSSLSYSSNAGYITPQPHTLNTLNVHCCVSLLHRKTTSEACPNKPATSKTTLIPRPLLLYAHS
jgi:hypothetical protein